MTYDIILFTDSYANLWRAKTLGPYRLATELRAKGFSVKVIDWCQTVIKNHRLTYEIINKLIGPNTLFVGFSNSNFYDDTLTDEAFDKNDEYYFRTGKKPNKYPSPEKQFSYFCREVKKKNPSTRIVFGGVNTGRDLNPVVDYLVLGYADAMVVDLAYHLRDGTPIPYMPGAHPGQRILDYDKLGQKFDFANSTVTYLEQDHVQQKEVVFFETSRGCMFKCKFCNYPLLGRKTTDPAYHKSIDAMVREFKYNWDNYKINTYLFVDDTFNETTRKMENVYRAIQESGVPDITFCAFLRIDLMIKHPEQAELLKQMGCKSALFGIETLNDASNKSMGKLFKAEQVRSYIKELNHVWAGSVSINGTFIFGLPHETRESITEWMQWIMDPDCPIDDLHISTLHLMPDMLDEFKQYGYKRMTVKGRELEHHWENESWNSLEVEELKKSMLSAMFFNKRLKTGAWTLLGAQTFKQDGEKIYPFDDLYKLPYYNLDRLLIFDKLKEDYHTYITMLCDYEKLNYKPEPITSTYTIAGRT